MRRPMPVVATLILALATISVVAWGVQPTRPVSTTDSPSASETTARRFYDAANHVITTGDLGMLRSVVSPDFVDTEPLVGTPPGRNGLERALLDLHETMPGIQLEIEELVADGPEVMAWIAIQGNRSASVLGLPVAAAPEPWGEVDVLLIAGGQVAERRASVRSTGRLSSLSSVPLGVVDPRRVVVTLERLTIQPIVGFDVATGENPHTLIAESAETQIDFHPVDGGASESGAVGQNARRVTMLYPEVPIVVPPGTVYTVRNTSRETASVLRLSMERPAPGGPAMGRGTRGSDGVTIHTVAGGNAALLPGGVFHAALGRIALAPGGSLALSGFEGVALMEVVTGELSVFAAGEAYLRRGSDGSGAVVALSGLDGGDGLLVGSETSAVLRNEGTTPIDVLLITLTTDAL